MLDSDSSQENAYNVTARETVNQLLNGYNGTIFMYGQSGSGKTFTMLGPDIVVETITKGVTGSDEQVSEEVQDLYGIIPRAIFDIFNEINRTIEAHGAQVELKINYFEIYQEVFNDLLSPNPNMGRNLKLRELKSGQVTVLGSDPVFVTSPEDIFELLTVGQRTRKVASTNQNDRSSRSHTIFVIEYTQKNKDGSQK